MTAISMACQDYLTDTDLTVLTDSLSCMQLLKSLQQWDFPLLLYLHPILHIISQRYQILSHVFARCASQKTHGHARIARVSKKCDINHIPLATA